jgi:hypothetical protein
MAFPLSLIRATQPLALKAADLIAGLLAGLAVLPHHLVQAQAQAQAAWAAVAKAVPVVVRVAVPVPVDRMLVRLAASLARPVALAVRRQLRLADPVAAH